jgi:VCBS repeat-containing protein
VGIAVNFPLIDLPDNGTLTMNGNGTFTYTPNDNFFGTDTFQYRATDGFATSNRGGTNDDGIATVTINVQDANDRPVANPDSGPTFNTIEDVNLNVPAPGVLANDTDGDPSQTLTAQIVAGSLYPWAGTLPCRRTGHSLTQPTTSAAR